MEKIFVKSCVCFATPNFAVDATLMGASHEFVYEGHNIKISLPNKEQADINDRDEEVATGSRWLANDRNTPVEYTILKVELEVDLNESILVPECVFSEKKNHNIAVFSGDSVNYKNVMSVIQKHSEIQNLAYLYWLEILRWSTNKPSIGMKYGNTSKISKIGVCLLNKENDQIVASSHDPISAYLNTLVTFEQWKFTQHKLTKELKLPMHIRFKFDAQESLKTENYERAIIEFAMSCEIYIRHSYFDYLPKDQLHDELIKYIESANINQFLTKFFKRILKDESEYNRALREDLDSLMAHRNQYVHMGVMTDATRERCDRYLNAVEKLFAIEKV